MGSITTSKPTEVLLGLATIGDESDPIVKNDMHTPEGAQRFFNVFRRHGYTELDSARFYSPSVPGSEEPITGQTDFASWATIASKVFPWPDLRRETVLKAIDDALRDLKIPKLDIMYLPDMDRKSGTTFEETHRAIDEAYKAGKFKEFGLSNALPNEVEEFLKLSEQHDLVKPTVYEGQYNIVARSPEDDGLFALLRKHGIRFHAYSLAAGGAFGGSSAKDGSKKQGTRGDGDSMLAKYHTRIYYRDHITAAANRITDAAEEKGLTGHGLALRWVRYHSALSGDNGDGLIVGASSPEQLEKNLVALEAGPLPDDLVKLVEDVWASVRHDPVPTYFAGV